MNSTEVTRLGHVESQVADMRKEIHDIKTDIREIRDSLHKQRGFLAGVGFAFTAIWTVAVACIGWFLRTKG